MSSKPLYQITEHPIGSVKEIWTISWPLILGLVCNGMMVVVDRLMLGQYSLDAMNAASTAGSAAFSFFVLPMIIAGISEVFVGRYHGLGQFDKMGSCVWQMIWFSLLISPFFIIGGHVAGPFLFNSTLRPDYAIDYFYTIIYFGNLFCINSAVMGFFIGQGRVRIITIAVAFANIVNFFLDYLLIYGTAFTPSLGVQGAAIATVISQVMLVATLFIAFIRKKNRETKGAGDWKIKPKLLLKSLKIAIPASFAHLSEYISFFVFLRIMHYLGQNYITVAVLLNTVYMMIFFIIEGISKGVTAISSNLIGANQYKYVKKCLQTTFKLHLLIVVLITCVLIFGSPHIFTLFIGENDRAVLADPLFLKQMYLSTLYMCVFYLFDGMTWVFVGVLTAASDTRFIMRVGTFAPWVLFILPVYLLSHWLHITADQVWLISVFYGLVHLSIYWMRYMSGIWRRAKLSEDPSIPMQES